MPHFRAQPGPAANQSAPLQPRSRSEAPAQAPPDPQSQRLDALITHLRGQGPAERSQSLARFERELSADAGAKAFHGTLLGRIDQLEHLGIRSREAEGEAGKLYGLLMDLYHISRWVKDMPGGKALQSPPAGKALPSIPLASGNQPPGAEVP